jgi:hypothetical protein
MNNLNSIFLFIFVFSILILVRGLGKVIGALSQKVPLVVVFSDRELILLGTSISYIITYILSK